MGAIVRHALNSQVIDGAYSMKPILLISAGLLVASLNGCAGSQAIQQIQAGRLALLSGNPAVALKHFEQAAAIDGNISGSPLRESAWTYVGRAYYEIKEYSPARQALNRALGQNQNDDVARLYLGLVGAREQTSDSNRKLIHAALQGIFERVEYIKYYTPMGEFWDPSGQLRVEFLAAIKTFSEPAVEWANALSRVESLTLNLENEIDGARRDESFQRRGGGSGGGDM